MLEAVALQLRGKQLLPSLSDGSIVLAAWLLALCVPPSLPLWQLLVGVVVMVMLGKHLYGGLGHNPFNPAMVAYAVLLVSFPVNMTHWPAAKLNANERNIASTSAWDALSGATPLDQLRQQRLNDRRAGLSDSTSSAATTRQSTSNDNTGTDGSGSTEPAAPDSSSNYRKLAEYLILGSSWKWVNLAWLAGGIYLLLLRIITWHIPLAVLSGVTAVYSGLALFGSTTAMPLFPALLSGAILLGAFFIATDPVSAATSRTGKLVYGFGIGILCVVIREFSSYPEGLAFAVLLMNTTVPLLDYLLTGPAGRHGSTAS